MQNSLAHHTKFVPLDILDNIQGSNEEFTLSKLNELIPDIGRDTLGN